METATETVENVKELKPKRGRKAKKVEARQEKIPAVVPAQHSSMKNVVGKKKTVRRRVIVDEDVYDAPDPKMYENVKFIFFNEEQKDVPIPYEWIDKWVKINQCKGIMYHGQTYNLPRVAFEYYKNECFEPVRSNVEEEIIPGKSTLISKVTGKKFRFRLQEIS